MSDLIQGIMTRFQDFDRNADGDPAIVGLSYLDFELPTEEAPQDARLVLILVEPRLLDPIQGAEDLLPRLLRYKGDLRAEGFDSRFISARLYRGSRQQDGRTLLALRSFLREVKTVFPNFLGVVLVGAFPEAFLVRRVIWTPNFRDVSIGNVTTTGERYLAIVPEEMAPRSDLVLADFNGNWESLYHEDTEELDYIRAIPDQATAGTDWPADGAVFSSTVFSGGILSFRDFFWIQDDDYDLLSSPPDQLKIRIRHQLRHPELSAEDLSLPNPIARPDIMISRVNALYVAVNPDPAIQGDDRKTPLDASGYPQAFTSSQDYTDIKRMFSWDQVLERRMLCDYFERNHRFRIGAFADLPFRAGAIATEEFSAQEAAGYLGAASSHFEPPLVQEKATLHDYVKWFKDPAVLRLIYAHSSPWNSSFPGNYNVAELEREVGGRPFRWRRVGNTYQPSLQDQKDAADLYLHRTIWQNGILSETGANLIIHIGCEVLEPEAAQTLPYYQEGYASFQNGEGILFCMNGVALVARARGFWDRPEGFPGALGQSRRTHFGDGWKAYFDISANNPHLGKFGEAINCKKPYWWSILGDWTVRLRYRGCLGILGFDPQFRALHVHADQAWIDGWNFDTMLNTIRGIGDIDGDGIAEFVISSEWGIGVLKHDGSRWRQVMAAPKDTWFGGWRYDASVNVGKDMIQAIGNFSGGAAREILLTSSWGIGVLKLAGSTLTSVVVQPNGTQFGGWLFDSRANQIVGFGDMNGDGLDEVVIISDWGIGVLAATGNTFNSLMLAPNGTQFGGWLFNSRQNIIHSVADFDGDGRAEILITSDWGIGILKLQTSQLTSIAMHANGSNLNGYNLNTKTAKVAAVGDLAGDRRACIVMADGDGLHVLQLSDGALVQIAGLQNGQHAGGWLLNTGDNLFGPVGDLDGDGRAEIVVTSPWGLGVLGLQGYTFRCPIVHPYGTHLSDWILERNDRVVGVGNFTGSNTKVELLIQKGR